VHYVTAAEYPTAATLALRTAMIPAMLGVMLGRYDDYSRHHGRRG
jgi:hypothetical protein